MPVIKLNGDNYLDWKKQVNINLCSAGLLPVVDGSEPDPGVAKQTDHDKWVVRDYKAQAIIFASLEKQYSSLVRTCDTSKTMFEKITLQLEDKSPIRAVGLYSKFVNYKFDDQKSLNEQFNEVTEIAKCLDSIGNTLPPSFVITKLKL